MKGFVLLKLLASLIFVFFTQLLIIIMWGEYVWLFKFSNGGVGGSPLQQVQPILWVVLSIELLLGIAVARYAFNKND